MSDSSCVFGNCRTKVQLGEELIPPSQLISYDRGNFLVEPRTLSLLERISEPICPIGIVGPMRTGKSFLMNILFQERKGFNLGSKTKACTKGIWIWVKKARFEETGREVAVLLMDTQGIYEVKKDKKYDNKVISLTMLLTDIFMYNTVSVIDQNAISKLTFVSALSKHLTKKKKIKKKETRKDEVRNLVPKFVWLIRDFFLEDCKFIETDDEYMEFYISTKQEQESFKKKKMKKMKKILEDDSEEEDSDFEESSDDEEESNKITKKFRALLPDRKCFRFVRPITDENRLQYVEDHLDEIRPEFCSKVKDFVEYVYSELGVKKMRKSDSVGWNLWDGGSYSILVKEYAKSINSDYIDCDSTFEAVKKKKNDELVQTCLSEFRKRLEEEFSDLPVDEDKFNNIISKIEELIKGKFEEELIEEFEKDVIFLESMEERYESEAITFGSDNRIDDVLEINPRIRFFAGIDMRKEEFARRNEKACWDKCEEILKNLKNEVMKEASIKRFSANDIDKCKLEWFKGVSDMKNAVDIGPKHCVLEAIEEYESEVFKFIDDVVETSTSVVEEVKKRIKMENERRKTEFERERREEKDIAVSRLLKKKLEEQVEFFMSIAKKNKERMEGLKMQGRKELEEKIRKLEEGNEKLLQSIGKLEKVSSKDNRKWYEVLARLSINVVKSTAPFVIPLAVNAVPVVVPVVVSALAGR